MFYQIPGQSKLKFFLRQNQSFLQKPTLKLNLIILRLILHPPWYLYKVASETRQQELINKAS